MRVRRKGKKTSETLRFRKSINLHTTTVYLVSPFSTDKSWIVATVDGDIRDPLTSNLTDYNLPANFTPSSLNVKTLAVSHNTFPSFDKLIVVPTRYRDCVTIDNYIRDIQNGLDECTLLVLHNGGRLFAYSPNSNDWGLVLDCHCFDDIVILKGHICVVDRDGRLYLITVTPKIGGITICKTLIDEPLAPASASGWRKRLVVSGHILFLVVRLEEKVFDVYSCWDVQYTVHSGSSSWGKRVDISKVVIFMATSYCFVLNDFLFPLKGFANCIVFSEGSFPRYGDNCWKVNQGEDDNNIIGVFRVKDGSFWREGESGEFPKLDWSPPAWVFNFFARSYPPAESLSSDSESAEEGEELVPNCRDDIIDKDVETHSDSEEPTSEHSNNEEMQSYSHCQDDADEQVTQSPRSKNRGSGATVLDCHEDEEATQILLSMNARNGVSEGGDSAQNITQSIPTAFTSCSVKRRRSDRLTTKFEGCDVRSDVVPTLQKIWRNHGNIIQNSNLRNRHMIARALEFLSDMIQILENNSALSLSDSQADCLTSTLSDLRCMHFEVKWLIPVIEKAIKLHKSKHLQESLNRISQSRSQVEERETALLEELAKVNEEKNKLKEEAAMVSIGIPFSGKYKFEELLGSGLT